jgi:hypothetical protein
VIFQVPTAAAFQRMDESFERYGAAVDPSRQTLVLTSAVSKTTSTLSFEKPASDQMTIDGTMNGHTVHLELKLRDLNSFMLKSRGFSWVQEVPFNR